jgi:uracil-DNA glycosylase family 4
MSNYVPGNGNSHAQLLVVGEAPGYDEDLHGIPFIGPSGEFLWEIFKEFNIDRQELWVTNVYKYRPPNNKIVLISQVCNPLEEEEKLWREIEEINPNCILALGGKAFEVLSGRKGIMKWRGSVLTTRDGKYKLVSTIHPANLIRNEKSSDYAYYPYIWKFIFKSDVKKAIIESKQKENLAPQRYIKVIRDSMELRRVIQANRHLARMASDIESINCIPVCMGIAWNKYEAYVIPLFNKLASLNLGVIPKSDQSFIWQQLDELLKAQDIVGQNYKYDQEKMEMLGFTYRAGPFPIKSDTLLKTHTIIPELPEKRMAMIQSIWTTLPFHKDEGKEFRIGKDNVEKLFHYCGLDSISTYETDEEQDKDLHDITEQYGIDYMEFYYNYVMRLHRIYMNIERIGFKPDLTARQMLKIKYQTQHDIIQARFDSNIPDFDFKPRLDKKGRPVKFKQCHVDHKVNVAAPVQIKQLIYQYLKLPARTFRGKVKSDEDTIVGLINNVAKDVKRRAVLTDIIEDRRTRKTLGTYVLSRLDFDGRIRGTYRITGTETGRSSTAILKIPIRPHKSGHAFQTLTKHGTIGSDIRTMYVCDEGFVFVQIDLSQAEPRIVSVLSEDWDLLKAFNSGKVDIHRRTAALVLDMVSDLDLSENPNPIADKIGKDSGERFLGKKSRNGGNYDMQEGELARNIATDAKRFNIDVQVSQWRARKMLENFHRASPNIRGVFHRDIQQAINETRTLINPFGRIRQFFERLGKDTYGEGYATIPQGTVADQVKTAIIKTYQEMPDFSQMLAGEAHDALLCRFPKGEWRDRAKVLQGFLECPIDFSVNCSLRRDVKLVIPADVEYSETNYRDLEKVKL